MMDKDAEVIYKCMAGVAFYTNTNSCNVRAKLLILGA